MPCIISPGRGHSGTRLCAVIGPWRHQAPRWTALTATYLICTNPRSGNRARWRMENTTDLIYEPYLSLTI